MIEPAYEELAAQIEHALQLVDFLPPDGLKVDPEAPFIPTGDEASTVRAASLVKVRTAPVRQLLGLPAPRYVVERQCQFELAIAGPQKYRRSDWMDAVLTALATIPADYPTLGGRAERLILGEQTDDELPPNGLTFSLTFTIRVRSGDPLGRTP